MTKQEELEFWQLKAALLQTQQVLFQYQAKEVSENIQRVQEELKYDDPRPV